MYAISFTEKPRCFFLFLWKMEMGPKSSSGVGLERRTREKNVVVQEVVTHNTSTCTTCTTNNLYQGGTVHVPVVSSTDPDLEKSQNQALVF